MTSHSKLGASSAKRWMTCPGSNALIAQAPPEESSPHAAAGTACHWVGETALLATRNRQILDWRHYRGGHCPENQVTVTDEMIDAARLYHDYVVGVAGPNLHRLLVEERFDLSWIYPGMFGTSDASVYHPERKHLDVFDLKFGYAEVDPVENPQGAFYSIGAAAPYWNEVDTITFHIVQPRVSRTPATWTFSRAELHQWAQRFREAAEAAQKPNAPRIATVDGCQWCPAKAICPEHKARAGEAVQTVATAREHPVAGMTPEDLAAELAAVREASVWVKTRLTALETYAVMVADKQGVSIPGHKLVAKRSVRQWRDHAEAIEFLRVCGVPDDDIFDSSLRSPAQLEKIIDSNVVAGYTVKPDNGVQLVPMTDKRPAVASSNAFNSAPAMPAGAKPIEG